MWGFIIPAINLDISNKCTLACPRCTRKWYTHNGYRVPGHDMTISEYKKIISYFDYINFCGNISDPVMNKWFIDFLKINYERNIPCEVHNAATGKKITWYKKAFNSNPNARWIFGLDGYPEESHIYRVNQKGNELFEAMKLCVQMGLNTTWRMITFKYNEEHVNDCKEIAESLGIIFEQVISSRFMKDDRYKPTNNFIARDYENHIPKMP